MRRLNLFLLTLGAGLVAGASAGAADKDAGGVVVDKAKRTVTIDARMAPRKINDPRYKEIYPIEVIACWPFPRGQKAHETVVTIEARPSAVHQALVELGLTPGKPVLGESKEPPRGPAVNVYLEVPAAGGVRRLPILSMPRPSPSWLRTVHSEHCGPARQPLDEGSKILKYCVGRWLTRLGESGGC